MFSWENHDLRFLRLQCSSIVILNHDFFMKTLTKSTFVLENIPPKCCYSASFGILWTHFDIFFWPKIGFQNFQFFPHYKIYDFPLQPKKGWRGEIFQWQIQIFWQWPHIWHIQPWLWWNKVFEMCVSNRHTLGEVNLKSSAP